MRTKLSVLQADLASKAGITQAYVSLIERKGSHVRLETRLNIANALGVPVEVLL